MLEPNQSDQQPLPLQAPPEVKSLIEQQRSLAEALGERGEAEEGVRHLERAYDLAKTGEERKAVGALLASYRTKFNLGQLWQFVNEGGEVFYESTDVEVIRARLLDSSIPRAATRCSAPPPGASSASASSSAARTPPTCAPTPTSRTRP